MYTNYKKKYNMYANYKKKYKMYTHYKRYILSLYMPPGIYLKLHEFLLLEVVMDS